MRDVVMVGAGPSALTAAIYTTREEIDTTLYEKAAVGGLAAVTDWVENYPGFPEGISGADLSEKLEKQAKRFGAKLEFGEVSSIVDKGSYRELIIDGEEVKSKVVLLATGSNHRKLGIAGEDEFYGRGVSYCATCDGAFFKDKKVAVVGGGNSAVQEAIFLTRYASHVDLIVRSRIRASEILQKKLQSFVDDGKITIHIGAVPERINAEDKKVSSITVTQEGQSRELLVDGVFVFIGLLPGTDFLKNSDIKLDDQGYILTDDNLQTSMKGVFASGDVRSGATAQIAAAVGEGAKAALSIREFLEYKED